MILLTSMKYFQMFLLSGLLDSMEVKLLMISYLLMHVSNAKDANAWLTCLPGNRILTSYYRGSGDCKN